MNFFELNTQNLRSNTDISDIVLQQSIGDSPSQPFQKQQGDSFSFQKLNDKLSENCQKHFSPKKQYTSERKKQNFKKWKTTITGFVNDEQGVNKDDVMLKSLKSSQFHKKSYFTKQLHFYKQNFTMEIKVQYFGTEYSKALYVDEDIRAAEFIVFALKEYSQDPKSDKSKYEFPNFTLAYKLIGSEVSPTKQTYNNDDDFGNESGSIEEESLEQADIDLESQVFYKTVSLLPSSELFGLTQFELQQTYEQKPEIIFLLIEDPEIKKKPKSQQSNTEESDKKGHQYTIEVNKDGNIKDCFNALNIITNQKYPKNKYYFSLKYSCVNYELGDINENFPVQQLPLHWLLIKERSISEPNLPISEDDSIQANNKILPNNVMSENGPTSNSYKFLTDDFKQLAKLEQIPLLYSYQEYHLIKQNGKYGSFDEVIVGLDYFDLHYTYVQKKSSRGKFKSFLKDLIQLLQLTQIGKRQCKRIPIIAITELNKQKKDKYFEISYDLFDGYTKKIFFYPRNDDKNVIKEAFSKLEYLVSQQQQQQ